MPFTPILALQNSLSRSSKKRGRALNLNRLKRAQLGGHCYGLTGFLFARNKHTNFHPGEKADFFIRQGEAIENNVLINTALQQL